MLYGDLAGKKAVFSFFTIPSTCNVCTSSPREIYVRRHGTILTVHPIRKSEKRTQCTIKVSDQAKLGLQSVVVEDSFTVIVTSGSDKVMGCCCSCSKSENVESSKEMELRAKSLAVSRNMTSPHVKVEESGRISGEGLALAGVQIEQDAAYWEWHVQLPRNTHCDTILFGVTSKKNRKFYVEQDDKIQEEEGEKFLRVLSVVCISLTFFFFLTFSLTIFVL